MNPTKAISAKVHKLLDERNYNEAYNFLKDTLNSFISSESNDYSLLTEITGGFISLGMESYNKEAVETGLSILTSRKQDLLKAATESSLNYFLGNAKHALYRIHFTIENPPYRIPTPELSKNFLFEAKSAYFKVFKEVNIKKLDSFSSAVFTNLANSLDLSGRIVEALQLYDMVLAKTPSHPQSLVSKAETLIHMARTTKFPKTLSFYSTIYTLYDEGSKILTPTKDVEESILRGKAASIEILKKANFDLNSLSSEYLLNRNEFKNHKPRIRFNLSNFLSLSEHSLYCNCNGARIDDLSIGFGSFATSDKKLMRLEIVVNRLKSEFAFARNLFYEYSKRRSVDNVHYQDLYESSINGIDIEKLRTSFRMCFGIFDKIAQGIFYLFDLEKGKNENIYFESFWESQRGPKDRWAKINEIQGNIHLTALYSIASDLSNKEGEFSFYKSWRNKLEHDIFSITADENDKFSLRNDEFLSAFEIENNFKDKTHHTLQLTRAAIFSFVFCVREQLTQEI